jgi:hypothetical protein
MVGKKEKNSMKRETQRGILLAMLFQFYAWILYLLFAIKASKEAVAFSCILLVLSTLLISLTE